MAPENIPEKPSRIPHLIIGYSGLGISAIAANLPSHVIIVEPDLEKEALMSRIEQSLLHVGIIHPDTDNTATIEHYYQMVQISAAPKPIDIDEMIKFTRFELNKPSPPVNKGIPWNPRKSKRRQ